MWIEAIYDGAGTILSVYRSDESFVSEGLPLSGIASADLQSGQYQAVLNLNPADELFADLDNLKTAILAKTVDLSKLVEWAYFVPVLAPGMALVELA